MDGHGFHSCVVGALGGGPIGKTVVAATGGGSYNRSHGAEPSVICNGSQPIEAL